MKNLAVIFGILLLTVSASAQKSTKNFTTTVFDVSLHCDNCVQKVESNIAYEKGVKDLKVNLEKKEVTVTYDASKNSDEKLIEAFRKLGYGAKAVSRK
ncbi:MAG: heavy-metal-associated domain-containing protein [Prevotellaceae bacterium]|jgi:copper chaperone CopZ|nr:heavy-metal-associated domain-containing protein [Prevotellaceae bacterium]